MTKYEKYFQDKRVHVRVLSNGTVVAVYAPEATEIRVKAVMDADPSILFDQLERFAEECNTATAVNAS